MKCKAEKRIILTDGYNVLASCGGELVEKGSISIHPRKDGGDAVGVVCYQTLRQCTECKDISINP